MSTPKYYYMVIVVNLVKQTWLFAWCCLLSWFCVWSLSGIRPSSCDNQSLLAVVACLLQGIAGVLQGLLHIYSSGLGGAHQDSGVGCPFWWLHGPIHPNMFYGVAVFFLFFAGCSILVMLPCWRKSRTNQGLGSSSYPKSAALQMTLRWLAKCPCRATGIWYLSGSTRDDLAPPWKAP